MSLPSNHVAIIGAGPAGLTYASLVAADNRITVFEKDRLPGGAFRLAGKAPLFQEVEAGEASFARYVADLVAACAAQIAIFLPSEKRRPPGKKSSTESR